MISVLFRVTPLSSALVCLMLMMGGYANGREMPLESPWRGSGLDFSFIEEKVNTRSCQRAPERILACIAAVQSLLDTSPRALQLVHRDWLANGRVGGQVQRRFGDVVVIDIRGEDQPEHANILDEISAKRQRILDWRQSYRQAGVAEADFTGLLQWARRQLIREGQLEDYAAAAINGYLSIEDAHARIVPAAAPPGAASSRSAGVAQSETDLEYSGIGVSLQSIAGNLLITRIVPDSPASDAGIRAADVILAVNGRSVAGQSVPEVVDALRGSAGTTVSLKIKSQNRIHETRVRRATVQVRNVSSSVLHDRGLSWGYLHIAGFMSDRTCADTRREMRRLVESDVDGIILDLRDNMGGKIGEAVCVADLFLEPRLLVMEMRSTRHKGKIEHLYSQRAAMVKEPVVTLVNAATGSASETLAGALQDHGRSLVIGERTFGKGTMQTLRPWNDSGSIMQFFTMARMYTPAGRTAQLVGIEPDLPVSAKPYGAEMERTSLRELDLFPTALPLDEGASERRNFWDLAGLNTCIETRGIAGERWLHPQQAQRAPDYRRDVAADLLHCLAQGGFDRVEGRRLASGSAFTYPRGSSCPITPSRNIASSADQSEHGRPLWRPR
jgi:carboxyl-terminal processing protease